MQLVKDNWLLNIQGNQVFLQQQARDNHHTVCRYVGACGRVDRRFVSFAAPLSAINLAPVAIFVASIFLGPRVGLFSGIIGSAIGFTIASTVGTVGGAAPGSALFPIFLLALIVARGPEGYIIGSMRRKNEILAMIIGTIYETLVFFMIDFFYTYPILLGLDRNFAFLDFGTLLAFLDKPTLPEALKCKINPNLQMICKGKILLALKSNYNSTMHDVRKQIQIFNQSCFTECCDASKLADLRDKVSCSTCSSCLGLVGVLSPTSRLLSFSISLPIFSRFLCAFLQPFKYTEISWQRSPNTFHSAASQPPLYYSTCHACAGTPRRHIMLHVHDELVHSHATCVRKIPGKCRP